MKPKLLIVDDRKENLAILENILKEKYDVVTRDGGRAVVDYILAADELPQLILLDVMMPEMNGHEVLCWLRSRPETYDIPVICITAGETEEECLRLGASDYIAKPFVPAVVGLRVKNQLFIYDVIHKLEQMVGDQVKAVMATRDNTVLAMANVIEYRNLESGSHVKRVTEYTRVLAAHLAAHSLYVRDLLGIGIENLAKAVPMHDVGKIGVPDDILLAPRKLSDEEFVVMKTHTTIGKSIIDSIHTSGGTESAFLRLCADIAYSHHEWYDGSGYPLGLARQDIPLAARVMAVADVYDALVTERVYKEAFKHADAVSIISRESGTHFDPVMIHAFLAVKQDFYHIAQNNYANL